MIQPSLFISHGAPDLALSEVPAHFFLRALGRHLPRPEAILIASAHDEADGVRVRAPARFQTWHDFGRLDRRLRDISYEPAGATWLATEAGRLLANAGLQPEHGSDDTLDHGAWVPLSLMFPLADIPVAAISIDPARGLDRSRSRRRVARTDRRGVGAAPAAQRADRRLRQHLA